MENYNQLLTEHLNEFNRLLKLSEKRLKELNDVPPDIIRTFYSKGHPQLNYRKAGEKKGHYLKKDDYQKAAMIVQKEYEEKIRQAIIKQKNKLEKFLCGFEPGFPENILNSFKGAKRDLITPIRPSDNDYISQWLASNPGCRNPFPDTPLFETQRGELVRTKSEKILADLFYSYNIPYQYEPAFILKNGITKYPDFVLLKVRERKTFYWEHMGLAGNEEYSSDNLNKLALYESSGLIPGVNLILTFESKKIPFDIKLAKQIIETTLL